MKEYTTLEINNKIYLNPQFKNIYHPRYPGLDFYGLQWLDSEGEIIDFKIIIFNKRIAGIRDRITTTGQCIIHKGKLYPTGYLYCSSL